MSREIEFDENVVCDICGKKGAFDFMGDCFCPDCLVADETGNTWDKNRKEKHDSETTGE